MVDRPHAGINFLSFYRHNALSLCHQPVIGNGSYIEGETVLFVFLPHSPITIPFDIWPNTIDLTMTNTILHYLRKINTARESEQGEFRPSVFFTSVQQERAFERYAKLCTVHPHPERLLGKDAGATQYIYPCQADAPSTPRVISETGITKEETQAVAEAWQQLYTTSRLGQLVSDLVKSVDTSRNPPKDLTSYACLSQNENWEDFKKALAASGDKTWPAAKLGTLNSKSLKKALESSRQYDPAYPQFDPEGWLTRQILSHTIDELKQSQRSLD